MNNKVELLKNGIKERLNKAQEEHKKGIDKSEGTVNIATFITGLLVIIIYIILKVTVSFSEGIEKILDFTLVVGITFFADSIYSIFKRWRITKNEYSIYNNVNQQIEKEFEQTECFKWLSGIEDDGITAIINSGLVNVYKNRDNVYQIMKEYLNNNKGAVCEIICYDGIADFRDIFNAELLCGYLNEGLQLKILSANPNVSHWTQHEIDMYINLSQKREYDITPLAYKNRNEINEMKNNWYDVIEEQTRNAKGIFEIKFHNSLPSLFFIRLNNRVFISGKLIGDTNVGKPPIFEYKKTKNGKAEIFIQYKEYFERLWKDPDLATVEQELIINPQLLIKNKVVALILQNTCNAMIEILRTACPDAYTKDAHFPLNTGADPIQAFFTVLDYAEPYESLEKRKITRRYNTNAVTRLFDIDIRDCNGINNLGGKGYPISFSHAIGNVMIKGRGLFRTTDPQKEPQDLERRTSCASLVLPLKFPEKSKNETLIDFVYEGMITRNRIDIPLNRKIGGQDENNFGKEKTKVFATVAFEFDDNIRHIIVPEETRNGEYNIVTYNYENGFVSEYNGHTFNTKQVTRRLIREAERCQKLLLEYFGFDSGIVNDADVLMDGKLDN